MVSKTFSRSIASFSQLLDNLTRITFKCFAFAPNANSAQRAAFSRHSLGLPGMGYDPSYYTGARYRFKPTVMSYNLSNSTLRRSHAISPLQRHSPHRRSKPEDDLSQLGATTETN